MIFYRCCNIAFGNKLANYAAPVYLQVSWRYLPSWTSKFAGKNVIESSFAKGSIPSRRKKEFKDYASYIILVIPVTCFALGIWQVKRWKWKTELNRKIKARTVQPAVPLPDNLLDLNEMEYCVVEVTGEFDHSNELIVQPRMRMDQKQPNRQTFLHNLEDKLGAMIVTPFRLKGRDYSILVNRGWVPISKVDPKTRLSGQIQGEVTLQGIVRHSEKKSWSLKENRPELNFWSFRDIDLMARMRNCAPVFIDLVFRSTVPDGPIGGQTNVNIRNTHLEYIITWFSLSVISAFIWYMRVFHGKL